MLRVTRDELKWTGHGSDQKIRTRFTDRRVNGVRRRLAATGHQARRVAGRCEPREMVLWVTISLPPWSVVTMQYVLCTLREPGPDSPSTIRTRSRYDGYIPTDIPTNRPVLI